MHTPPRAGGPPPFDPAAAALLAGVRGKAPRVHCITNTVAQAFTANALLAAGAVPSMTTSPEEIVAFVESADALLVNLGTLDAQRRAVIFAAIRAANEKTIPWVLDPVFIDRSPPRSAFAEDVAALGPAAVRGNAGEIAALARGGDAAALARRLGAVVIATGATDRVTDGTRTAGNGRGHPLMAKVTAMGCAGAAVTAAVLAVAEDRFAAAAAATLALAVAGERAALKAEGPGSFATAYLDALHGLDAAPGEDAAGREERA